MKNAMQWLDFRARWEANAKYWGSVPRGSLGLIHGGVFCLFAAFGLVTMMVKVFTTPLASAIIVALMTGLYGAGLAFAASRSNVRMIVVIVFIEVVALLLFLRFTSGSAPAGEMNRAAVSRHLEAEGAFTLVLIIAGYTLITGFVRREGVRVFGPMMEIKLATEVHRALAPPISRRIGEFEIYGASVPSGAVGGDLVDLIEGDSRWIAYVADVSGHGVPAGMIMAMVKSACRMGASTVTTLSGYMARVNRVLASSCAANTFVTLACLRCNGSDRLEFALAGHLPILHYRRRLQVIQECAVRNLPLAIQSDAQFESSAIDCEPGDLLAVLTDGFTEATDAAGSEFGLDTFKEIICSSASLPLGELVALLRERALQFGKQTDDQSLLLLRRNDHAVG